MHALACHAQRVSQAQEWSISELFAERHLGRMCWLHFQGAQRLQGVFAPRASGLGLGPALLAELLGTLLLQFLGGLSGSAVGNGLALAAAVSGGEGVGLTHSRERKEPSFLSGALLLEARHHYLQSYLAINISGASLNPAVVAAQAASGHLHWVAALLLSVTQVRLQRRPPPTLCMPEVTPSIWFRGHQFKFKQTHLPACLPPSSCSCWARSAAPRCRACWCPTTPTARRWAG